LGWWKWLYFQVSWSLNLFFRVVTDGSELWLSDDKLRYRWYEIFLLEDTLMTSIEKISIALPREMVAIVREAVEQGEYASSSEVIRDALRDWTLKRSVRNQGIEELRQVWQEALRDKTPGIAVDDVLDRLERKYQALADQARS
jgi:antitoxin ParD1/3/4